MRLGGFVLFGNNVGTVRAAVESLTGVCDDVVAVDSGATDGSRTEVLAAGARCVDLAWQGYGAGRRFAIEQLGGCDYVVFLDSDERFDQGSQDTLRRWKSSDPKEVAYRLAVRDWVELDGRRFLYREGRRVRLCRRQLACYTDRMLVHESTGLGGVRLDGVVVDHAFLSSLEARDFKERKYAFLWGLQAWAEGRRSKWPPIQRWAHFLRDVLLRGAFRRGGVTGARVAWSISNYSTLKYEYLEQLLEGKFEAARHAFAEGRWSDVFRLADDAARTGRP